jgi:dienelactone hydrolase
MLNRNGRVMDRPVFPFGHWRSPISADSVAEGALRFGRIQIVDKTVYWSESRPAERGRAPIMCWTSEAGAREILPAAYSARSTVHEYGGGEFLIAAGRLFFVNAADQDVYEAGLAEGGGASIRRLTDLSATSFADFTWDGESGRLICVGETHRARDGALPENALWAIPVRFGEASASPRIVLSGHDFYASPRLSPCGRKLAFLAWDLPAMPWDAGQLYLAEAKEDGSFSEPAAIAGGNGSACFQPEWGSGGSLYFVWDADGFGNLHCWRDGSGAMQVTGLDAELAMPLWSFNAASYALLPEERVYCTFKRHGEAGAGILDLRSGDVRPRENGFGAVQNVAGGCDAAALAGMSDSEALCIALDTFGAAPAVIRRSAGAGIGRGYIAKPSRVEIPGKEGPIHGLLYGPANPEVSGPKGELPPLIISLHGGPTGAASRGLKPRTLFFTSRGFSWLDLDYAGSTGYGRAYRERLKGKWGVADVEDTICAAEFAGSTGIASRRHIFVSGGSAGGYTVLMAIATAPVFRGAASYYGICDLVQLQKTTHKFEHGYQSTLLGATLEENEERYRERSPIHHAERITTPLILFQGANDKVVSKEQSIAIAEALRARGVEVEYYEFPGEGHGFRQAETISTCLESELAFYRKLMGRTNLS